MIKVENNMLVLDNTFTKEDVQAIDEFVKINVDRERERIIKLLQNDIGIDYPPIEDIIKSIKNFGE